MRWVVWQCAAATALVGAAASLCGQSDEPARCRYARESEVRVEAMLQRCIPTVRPALQEVYHDQFNTTSMWVRHAAVLPRYPQWKAQIRLLGGAHVLFVDRYERSATMTLAVRRCYTDLAAIHQALTLSPLVDPWHTEDVLRKRYDAKPVDDTWDWLHYFNAVDVLSHTAMLLWLRLTSSDEYLPTARHFYLHFASFLGAYAAIDPRLADDFAWSVQSDYYMQSFAPFTLEPPTEGESWLEKQFHFSAALPLAFKGLKEWVRLTNMRDQLLLWVEVFTGPN